MTTTSYKVSDSLYLNLHVLSPETTVFKAETNTDFIFVVDVSGSMSDELPSIRKHIKTRLAADMKPGDRFSLIMYSGRNQCTNVLEAVDLRNAADLNDVHRAVDRWVQPIGLTAFVDPLVAARELAIELRKSKPMNGIALFQMTDGRDNCYGRAEILAACDKLREHVDSATLVEWGMWTDRSLMTAMAERLGGSLAYADGSVAYTALAQQVLNKRVKSAKLRTVDVGEGAWLAFSVGNGELTTYAITGTEVAVPDVAMTLATLSRDPMGRVYDIGASIADKSFYLIYKEEALAYAYAAVALLSLRSQPKPMYQLLRALGDVALIDTLSVCFGKQAYTNAAALAQAAVFDAKARYVAGFDQNKVPRDDAFTVVDLVKLLADEGAELDESATKFARIGPSRVDASTIFALDEADSVAVKFEVAKATRDVDAFSEVRALIDQIIKAKGPSLSFVHASPRAKITGVKWNMKEANLSIDVRREGTVDLAAIPSELFGTANLPHQSEFFRAGIPTLFSTSIMRTRPLVASGIRNIDKITVFVSERAWTRLANEGVISRDGGYTERVEIDLAKVPLTNMKMRDGLSVNHLVGLHWRLLKLNAQSKVYEHYRKEYPSTDWIVEKYGTEAAKWLDNIGIKRYGYAPAQRGNPTKSGDVREKRELLVKIEDYSSLPKVTDVIDRLKAMAEATAPATPDAKTAKKARKGAATLTPSMELLADAIRANDAFIASPEYTSVANADGRALLHQQWLDARITALETEADDVRAEIAKSTFTAIVGQGGFVEYVGQEMADKYALANVKMPDGKEVNATVEFKTSLIEL